MEENGLMEQLIEVLAQDLEGRGCLDLTECFVDDSATPHEIILVEEALSDVSFQLFRNN